jgi:signal transduction histidine kinase
VVNLLSNAVKFTDPSGAVHLALTAEADSVSITVRDTGRGMAAEFLPRVFERFAQQERGSGLGLGLAITKEIIDLHGGTIEARSPGPGQGATFIVRLRALKLPTYP